MVRVLDVSIYDTIEEIGNMKTERVELKDEISILKQQIIENRDELVKIAKNIENYWEARISYHNSKYGI